MNINLNLIKILDSIKTKQHISEFRNRWCDFICDLLTVMEIYPLSINSHIYYDDVSSNNIEFVFSIKNFMFVLNCYNDENILTIDSSDKDITLNSFEEFSNILKKYKEQK